MTYKPAIDEWIDAFGYCEDEILFNVPFSTQWSEETRQEYLREQKKIREHNRRVVEKIARDALRAINHGVYLTKNTQNRIYSFEGPAQKYFLEFLRRELE